MVLDPDDRCVSEERVRAHTTPRRDARRARMVPPAVGGCPAWRTAEIMQVDVSTVMRWRDRFAREGLTGPEDRPRALPLDSHRRNFCGAAPATGQLP
ncbi:helix-turn-helix domain-containing protein [Streptomyces sp. NPDC058266]|uniref:helix-turn-helix domain-containing protein n=1 Tax=Streptomyces sp. NPDC058266 TaxID=3346412 RepID=UPI0036EE832F